MKYTYVYRSAWTYGWPREQFLVHHTMPHTD